MRYLLDTHVLLWMRQNDPRLNRKRWERRFYSPRNEILFSRISIWEIAIKRNLGKLKLEGSLETFEQTLVTDHGFRLIGLEIGDLCRLEQLETQHRDPFDRLLIAQALERDAITVTNDTRWSLYPIEVQW